MIKLEFEVSLDEMRATLEAMHFVVYTPSDEYIAEHYKRGDVNIFDILDESGKTFVRDGKDGPVLGPIEPVFSHYYRRGILKMMREY